MMGYGLAASMFKHNIPNAGGGADVGWGKAGFAIVADNVYV